MDEEIVRTPQGGGNEGWGCCCQPTRMKREREKRELWNFSVHSCGIALCSWKMYQSDRCCCRYSPHCRPADRDFSNRPSLRSLLLHPSFFPLFLSLPLSISLCLIMLIETDTAIWTLGVILAFTCLVDKSVANWDVTWEPACPSRLNVPSQKPVAFWHRSNCPITCLWCQFKSLRGTSAKLTSAPWVRCIPKYQRCEADMFGNNKCQGFCCGCLLVSWVSLKKIWKHFHSKVHLWFAAKDQLYPNCWQHHPSVLKLLNIF